MVGLRERELLEFSVVEKYLVEFRNTKQPYLPGTLLAFVGENFRGYGPWRYSLLRIIQYDAKVRCVNPREHLDIDSSYRAARVPLNPEEFDDFTAKANTLTDTEFRDMVLGLQRTTKTPPPPRVDIPYPKVPFSLDPEVEFELDLPLDISDTEARLTYDPETLDVDLPVAPVEEEEELGELVVQIDDEPPRDNSSQTSKNIRDELVRGDNGKIVMITKMPTSMAGKMIRLMGPDTEITKDEMRKRLGKMTTTVFTQYLQRLDSTRPIRSRFVKSDDPPYYETPNPPYFDKITGKFVRDRSLVKIFQVAYHLNLWDFIAALMTTQDEEEEGSKKIDTAPPGEVGFVDIVKVGPKKGDAPMVTRDGFEHLMNIFDFDVSVPGTKRMCILGSGYGMLPRALLFLRAVESVYCVGDRNLDQEFNSILGDSAYEVGDDIPDDFSGYGYVYWNLLWSDESSEKDTAKFSRAVIAAQLAATLTPGAVVVVDKTVVLDSKIFLLSSNEPVIMSHGFLGAFIWLNKWIRK